MSLELYRIPVWLVQIRGLATLAKSAPAAAVTHEFSLAHEPRWPARRPHVTVRE